MYKFIATNMASVTHTAFWWLAGLFNPNIVPSKLTKKEKCEQLPKSLFLQRISSCWKLPTYDLPKTKPYCFSKVRIIYAD